MNSKPTLTVIICTYNRASLLRYCLESLTNQVGDHQFSVIVVDNNSDDDTQEVIDEFESRLPITGLLENNQGLSFARNTGYESATTDWVAYLDDDAKAKPNWIDEIIKTIETTDFKAFGGIYDPWYLEGKEKWFKDRYASNRKFFSRKGTYELSGIQFISGGNAVYHLETLRNTTGFPTHLGMSGKKIYYGEELAVQSEIRSKGAKLGINTDLLIDHLAPKKKQHVSFLLESAKRKGEVYWEDKKRSSLKLIRFTLQGILSVSMVLLSSLIKLAGKNYYKENFQVDFNTKFHFYWQAIKNYK